MNILLLTLIAASTTTGVATQYTEKEHLGNPLFCDRGDGLVYDRETGPWVAFPKWMFDEGLVECGDQVTVYVDGWDPVTAQVWDAGLLSSRTFRDGLPVVVDVPEYWATWKQPVPYARVVNWSKLARECVKKGWCD